MAEHEIGVVGLATMGENLARNLASHGARVVVFNRTRKRTDDFMAAASREGDFGPAGSLEELARTAGPPRAILLMGKAGAAVDDAIDSLSRVLEPGDTIIDGGNSLFHDTRRRAVAVEKAGLGFIGAGVSGGEEGALHGPSIMPGGTRASYERVAEMLTGISAKVDGTPCCTYIGPDGAGHFVKMVHNGIEYADIQLIAETYDFLRHTTGMTPSELAAVFRDWNEGKLQSYLIEITANVLAKTDAATKTSLVDVIEDEAEQKGTGRWTSESALELGVPLTGITEAVFARILSSQKPQRVKASEILAGPPSPLAGEVARRALRLEDRRVRAGLRAPPRGVEGVRLGPRPGRPRDDLARRLHHPGEVPKPDQRCVRRIPRPAESHARALFPGGACGRPATVAVGRQAGHRPGRANPRIRLVAGVLRRLPAGARSSQLDPKAARLFPLPPLPPHRSQRGPPHPVGAGPPCDK